MLANVRLNREIVAAAKENLGPPSQVIATPRPAAQTRRHVRGCRIVVEPNGS
jgi:hypothetical protein